jgi:outer membrane protein OmpA-like peptidoglycan-associated protein
MSPQEDSSAQSAHDVAGDAAAAVAATAAAPSIAPKAARRPASALPRRLPLWIALALLAAAAVVSAINGRTLMGWGLNIKARNALAELPAQVPAPTLVETLNLLRLRFAAGMTDLPPGIEETLQAAARALAAQPETVRLQIVSYCDKGEAPSAAAAFDLSLRRAATLVDALSSRGVPVGRLEAIGRGEQPRPAEIGSSHVQFRLSI